MREIWGILSEYVQLEKTCDIMINTYIDRQMYQSS